MGRSQWAFLVLVVGVLASPPARAQATRLYLSEFQGQTVSFDTLSSGVVTLVQSGGGQWDGLAIDAASSTLYAASSSGLSINKSGLAGPLSPVITSLLNPRQIALDTANQRIYWAEQAAGRVGRAATDGTSIITIALESGVTGVALDGAAHVYWSSTGTQAIRRAALDGSSVQTLATGSTAGFPTNLAVDAAAGKLYWNDCSTPGNVRRSNLDGSSPETIVTGLAVCPAGIAIDHASNVGYFSDSGSGVIQRFRIDQPPPVTATSVLAGLNAPAGLALLIPAAPAHVPAVGHGVGPLAAALVLIALWSLRRASRRARLSADPPAR